MAVAIDRSLKAGLMPHAMAALDLEVVSAILRRHVALYRRVKPTYQAQLVSSLAALWDPTHRDVLDVGGGTGLLAEAMRVVFALRRVVSVDIEDRFLPGLGIETSRFDGTHLPFGDGSFDAVMLNNVLHHVPGSARPALLRECARVTRGPIYVKDHIKASRLDGLRLAALDAIGNIPFAGMVSAQYLTRRDWTALASASGLVIEAETGGNYRSGPFARLFPNRLEVTMRLARISN